MSKLKTETKTEKSFDEFFDIENHDQNEALNFALGAKILTREADREFRGKNHAFFNFLKQAFLFLPGTFLLSFVGVVGAIIFMDIFVLQRPLETLPPSAPFQIILLSAIGLLAGLMTWFGLGDLKNRKHFAIPVSIFMSGAIIGVILKTLEKVSETAAGILENFNHYIIYLLPLFLIVAVLTKGWVDKDAE